MGSKILKAGLALWFYLTPQLSPIDVLRVLWRVKVQCHIWVWRTEKCHPNNSSREDLLPQLLGEQSADSLQHSTPSGSASAADNHFNQGPDLPKVAHIQWLIMVRMWRYSRFWSIAVSFDGHMLQSSLESCMRVCQAYHTALRFHFFLCLILFSLYLSQCWSLINILYSHSCLSVCFQWTQPATQLKQVL